MCSSIVPSSHARDRYPLRWVTRSGLVLHTQHQSSDTSASMIPSKHLASRRKSTSPSIPPLCNSSSRHPFLHRCPPFLELVVCPLRMTRWSLFSRPSPSYTTSWDSTLTDGRVDGTSPPGLDKTLALWWGRRFWISSDNLLKAVGRYRLELAAPMTRLSQSRCSISFLSVCPVPTSSPLLPKRIRLYNRFLTARSHCHFPHPLVLARHDLDEPPAFQAPVRCSSPLSAGAAPVSGPTQPILRPRHEMFIGTSPR